MGNLRQAPSGNWRAEFRDPASRKRSKTFRTKRDARAYLAQVEADKNRGLFVNPAAGRTLFRDYAVRWWEARNVEVTTAAASESRLRLHVLPAWGDWPLAKIDYLAVQG